MSLQFKSLPFAPDIKRPWQVTIGIILAILISNNVMGQSDQPAFGTAVDPDKYIIRPGDKFRIDFWDGAVETINITVTPEGAALLSDMGRLEVSDLSLAEARRKIGILVESYYPDSNFSISLEGLRAVRMFVSGGVRNPGFYDGTVANRVSEYIQKAGGLIPGASHRNILLADGGEDIKIDLLCFERGGDFESNPFVYSGEIIVIPMIVDSSGFVQISGAVNRPDGFEYSPGDNLGTLIDLAYGLNGLEGDSAFIYRSRSGQITTMVVGLDNTDFAIMPGDKIVIETRRKAAFKDYFAITGEINLPGRFPYFSEAYLSRAIAYAGGVTDKADLASVTIYRRPEYDQVLQITHVKPLELNEIKTDQGMLPVSVDIDKYYPDKLDEIEILPGDSIVISALTNTVSIFGHINRPGTIPCDGPITVRSLIGKAGGYARGADKGKIRLIRKGGSINIEASSGTRVRDGDIVIIPEQLKRKSFLEKARDWALIVGGLGVAYLAVDNAAE